MYKIIVAEDEYWVRNHIAHLIKWDKIDCEVVAEAENGSEALELCQKLNPDIVLTDVCMPNMDGLELCEKLRDICNGIKIIVITGYDEFTYVQKALKLSVNDYVLKPVEENVLLNAVKKLTDEIESERKKESSYQLLENEVKEGLKDKRESFLADLLFGNIVSQTWVQRKLNELNIDTKNKNYICFCVHSELDNEEDEEKKTLELFCVRNIVYDTCMQVGNCEIFSNIDNQIICLISSEDTTDQLTEQVESIAESIKDTTLKLLDVKCSIGIGMPCDNIINIGKSSKQAQDALSWKNYLGDSVYNFTNTKNMTLQTKSFTPDKDQIQQLVVDIRSGNEEEIRLKTDEILKSFSSRDLKPIDYKTIYINIVLSILHIAQGYKSFSEQSNGVNARILSDMNKIMDEEGLKQSVLDIAMMFSKFITQAQQTNKRRFVDVAIEYIDKHYNEQISLRDVADELYLNPAYFCKIFHEQHGSTFTKYLTSVRINKAKELLMDPRKKVYEISELVGYTDVQYFNKIFKKQTGLYPTAYRDKVK